MGWQDDQIVGKWEGDPVVKPAKKSLGQNIAAEALGGFSDLDSILPTPAPLGMMIQTALGMKGPDTQGDPAFHDSYAGRAVRFAAPSAVPLGGQGLLGKAIASGSGVAVGAATGLVDKWAENADLPFPARVAATLAPSLLASGGVAATKGLIRGGPAKGREMAENIDNMKQMGIEDWSLSQIAPEGNLRIPYFEQGAGFAFGGKTVFEKTSKAQADQLQQYLESVSGGNANQAEEVGKKVWQGIFGEKGWVHKSKKVEKFYWAPVDNAIKAKGLDVVEPVNFRKALDEIVGSFDNPELGAAANSDKVAAAGYKDVLDKAGGKITYNDFTQIRNAIGEANKGRPLMTEKALSEQQAGKLWGALLEDYADLANKAEVGGELESARAFTKEYHETSRNFFKSIFGKEHEPTKVVDELVAGNFQQPAKLRALKEALGPEFQPFVEYSINRLGVPPGSNAAEWSLETYGTRFKNAFGASAKSGNAVADALLGPKGNGVRDGAEAVAKIAQKTKEGAAIMYNSSGTAGSGIAGASIQAVLTGLVKAGPQLIGGGIGAAVGGGLGLAMGIAAGAGAVNLTARLMTSPRFGTWLSKTAFQSNARLPAALVALSQTPLESEELESAKAAFLAEYQRQFPALSKPPE